MAGFDGMVRNNDMATAVLLKAGIRRQRVSIIGTLILIFILSLALVAAIAVSTNSGRYIAREMERLGFGDLTAWVSGATDLNALAEEVEALPEVERAMPQPLIFAGYRVGGVHSDNEGQLISWDAERYPYRFFRDHLDGYMQPPQIRRGEIFLSPSMRSSYDVSIGDEIVFELFRNGGDQTFLVAGYFEDPFMGSSMIDMKSFLISEADAVLIADTLRDIPDFDRLGREGAMLHIFRDPESGGATSALSSSINEQTGLEEYAEFSYSNDSIYGFMLILQNIFTGFLIAFALVLTLISMIVMSHSISTAIEQEYADMGILKAVGCTTGGLRLVQVLQYAIGIVGGMLLGLLAAVPLTALSARLTVTSTGVLMPDALPVGRCVLALMGIALVLTLFICLKTARIARVEPIRAIRGALQTGAAGASATKTAIDPNGLGFHLALRQLVSGKARYVGIFLTAALLVFFSSAVGRMDAWLGPNGEGLMNAFSVAAHDLGVQPMGDVDMEAIEETINSYSPIADTYRLAMESVTVNGVPYTANVIDEPERFHLLSGATCTEPGQIVVTEFVAADLGIGFGDSISVSSRGRSGAYTVSGIYECANEMGANIGMNRDGYSQIADVEGYIWCHHYILEDGSVNNDLMEHLLAAYRVDLHVHTNRWSGLDGIVGAMHLLTLFMYVVTAVFILVVIALTSGKLLYTEQSDMAVLKSIGMTSGRLRMAFALRFGIIVATGSAVGIAASSILGDSMIAALLKLFGIGDFHTTIGFANWFLPPLFVTVLFVIFAYALSRQIKRMGLIDLIRHSA